MMLIAALLALESFQRPGVYQLDLWCVNPPRSNVHTFNHNLFNPGKFNLSPDPRAWGNTAGAEDDDWLHDPRKGKGINDRGTIFTLRGISNVGCLAILAVGLTTLLYVSLTTKLTPPASANSRITSAGYPIIDYFTRPKPTNLGGYNLGGINATGQSNF
jgi:beta-glucan synthesis-associated protein KRE6